MFFPDPNKSTLVASIRLPGMGKMNLQTEIKLWKYINTAEKLTTNIFLVNEKKIPVIHYLKKYQSSQEKKILLLNDP